MNGQLTAVGTDAIPEIQDLARRIWPDTFGTILTEDQIEYMLDMMYGTDSLRKQMSRSRLQFFLYQIGGVSIGFMSLEGVGAAVRVHKLYLLPDMQGKGHGKRMLDYAQTWAREQGASYLLLNVNKYNRGAIAFYEKVGFHISKEEDIDIGSGYWMNDYQMECPL